ncbi:MAG: hypothetical protein WC498_04245 [Candidatus Saccharimonadales bacterium]
MIPDHETRQPATDPDAMTRQEEVALDQGVMNPYMEHAYEDGSWPQQKIPVYQPKKRRPTYEPRHGDSEADMGAPTYYQNYEPLTVEQLAERAAVRNGIGHRQAMAAGIMATHDAIVKETAGENISYQMARERAAAEKRANR